MKIWGCFIREMLNTTLLIVSLIEKTAFIYVKKHLEPLLKYVVTTALCNSTTKSNSKCRNEKKNVLLLVFRLGVLILQACNNAIAQTDIAKLLSNQPFVRRKKQQYFSL